MYFITISFGNRKKEREEEGREKGRKEGREEGRSTRSRGRKEVSGPQKEKSKCGGDI